MDLPKDPVILLSVVNAQLRDQYPTLKELAAAYMVEESVIKDALFSIRYHYDENLNQFTAV